MTAVIHQWTPREKLDASEIMGRPRGRVAGGYIADRVGLKQGVALCPNCTPKFNALKVDYVTKSNLPYVAGYCDGCGDHADQNHLYVHKSFASNL